MLKSKGDAGPRVVFDVVIGDHLQILMGRADIAHAIGSPKFLGNPVILGSERQTIQRGSRDFNIRGGVGVPVIFGNDVVIVKGYTNNGAV